MKYLFKTIIASFLLLLSSAVLRGQNATIDSLKTVLTQHSQKDSTAVNLLNELGAAYSTINADSSFAYLKKASEMAASIDFKKGAATSRFLNGMTYMVQSNLDVAIGEFTQAAALFEAGGYKADQANSYTKIGLASYYKRDYEVAIAHFKHAIEINKSLGNLKEAAIDLKYIGYAYSDIDNFDQSLLHYNQALELNKEINNKEEIASCLNNVGILYADRSNFPLEALKYYNESLVVSKEINDSLGMFKSINNMGNLYSLRDEHLKAIEHLENSLAIQRNIGLNRHIGTTLNNIGNNYKKLYVLDKALQYLDEALVKSKEVNDLFTASQVLLNLGDVQRSLKNLELAEDYYQEAETIKTRINDEYNLSGVKVGLAYTMIDQKEYAKALSYAKEAGVLADKLNIIGLQRDVYDANYRAYKNSGNYKKALENFELYKVANDTLFNKKNVQKLAEIEYDYKYKRALDSASIRELTLKQKVISTTNNLEKSQRNVFLTIIAFLLTAIILGGIIFYLKLRNEKAKTQNISIEQKLLRLQMTPHFIFNSLSVLQGMILNKEEKKSVSYLSKFSKLLRITLENSRDKMVPLAQELEGVNNYMELQNLDAEKPYAYTIKVDDKIDEERFEIPPMLIQPFIENAIEHAFADQKAEREIAVALNLDDQQLICTIKDNGVGIDAAANNGNTHKKSLATKITSERLAMLAKDFKQEASINIEDRKKFQQQGTQVTLVIPYKTESQAA